MSKESAGNLHLDLLRPILQATLAVAMSMEANEQQSSLYWKGLHGSAFRKNPGLMFLALAITPALHDRKRLFDACRDAGQVASPLHLVEVGPCSSVRLLRVDGLLTSIAMTFPVTENPSRSTRPFLQLRMNLDEGLSVPAAQPASHHVDAPRCARPAGAAAAAKNLAQDVPSG